MVYSPVRSFTDRRALTMEIGTCPRQGAGE